MTKIKSQIISSFMTLSILFTSPLSAVSGKAAPETMHLKDSGISYIETTETINNPGAGYTSCVWAACKPGSTPVYSPTGSLILFLIDIGAFSGGVNGVTSEDGTYTEGTDYDLDEAFFDSWKQTFENCRKNGCMIALRFRYDALGKSNPEPAAFEKVLDHVEQIKKSGLLEEYKDIIAYVESGFVGAWGEQHSGKFTSNEYKAKLLDALLKCVPSPIPVTVRTPDIFSTWLGIDRSELANYYPEPDSDAARVGMYDDGYMGSNSDLGTYANREAETEWLSHQTLTSYFGGEFSGNLEFAQKYDTYLPENAIPEMYKTHLSYINANIFNLYKNYTFGTGCDVDGVDNSAYYGQTVYKFIRDHIGYRFVLRSSKLSEAVLQGGQLELNFKVENTGFANPIPSQKAELIIERDGKFIRTEVDINSNKWYSRSISDESLKIKLPDSFPEGEWNAYLKLSVGSNSIDQIGMRSVRFANENTWNGGIGANYLGSFSVSKSEDHGTDNFIYQVNSKAPVKSDSRMYTVNGHINLDGEMSFPQEWTEDMLIAENGENKLYMTADDKYFYIKGTVPGSAESPVYNLRIENAETERSYWAYYMPNGYVYFNNGSHENIICRWSGDTVEFRVAFGDTMATQPGTKYNRVRIFVQDSANDWAVVSDISSEECSVPSSFSVFSDLQQISLANGDIYPVKVDTVLENASYQWYKNGEAISGANSENYTIKSEDGPAMYSVRITTSSGTEKTVEICNVLEILSDRLIGDTNTDGEVNLADAVLIMQFMANPQKYHISEQGRKNADCSGNDGITANDAYAIQLFTLGLIDKLPI